MAQIAGPWTNLLDKALMGAVHRLPNYSMAIMADQLEAQYAARGHQRGVGIMHRLHLPSLASVKYPILA